MVNCWFLFVFFFGVCQVVSNEVVVDPSGDIGVSSVPADGNLNHTLVSLLVSTSGESDDQISVEVARDIVSLLEKLKNHDNSKKETEPQNILLQYDEPQSMTPSQIVLEMAEIVSGVKDAEDNYGASDPAELVAEFEQRGFLAQNPNLPKYKKDPASFIEDTKEGLYSWFVKVARKGGYL